jgi:DNA-binding NtrC family response regulator
MLKHQEPEVLLIESHDKKRKEFYCWISKEWGQKTLTAKTGAEGISLYKEHINNLRVVLINQSLSDQSGVGVLEKIKAINPIPEVIVLMDDQDTNTAVEIMRKGAHDILVLPSFKDEMNFKIKKAMEIDCLLNKLEKYMSQQEEICVDLRREEFQKLCHERRMAGQPITEKDIIKYFPPSNMRKNVLVEKLKDDYIQENPDVFVNNTFSILIIEDEEEMRETLVDILSADNITILEAANAAKALSIIKSKCNIDLIILDIGLPDISGDELLKEIRKILTEVEVIVVTAYVDDVELVVSTMRDGVCDYMTKPIEPMYLLLKITDLLVKKHIKKILPKFWQEVIKRQGGQNETDNI